MATNAITLNGSSQYATVSNFAAIDALTDGTFTAEIWINQDATGGGAYAAIIELGDVSAGGAWLETENAAPSTGVNFGYVYSGNDADGYKDTGVFTNGTWTHLAIVCTNGAVTKIYKDGTEISYTAQNTPTLTALSDTGKGFRSGRYWDVDSGYFKGLIGGFFRVWNVVRTQAQISADKSLGLLTANETGLIINCKFGEGSGTSTNNEASPANDMNFTGAPSWGTGPTITEKNYGGVKTLAALGVG